MKIENHILGILQLYEYAMSIGKTLNWKENCDAFLKLVLKRKNLNACWIIAKNEKDLEFKYAIPVAGALKTNKTEDINNFLKSLEKKNLLKVNDVPSTLLPFHLNSGELAIFNLRSQGFLFLYSKNKDFSQKDISQLEPVIDKFYNQLKACKAQEEQKNLLKNLKKQNQELNDYAQMVSHDLKSPLRNIDTLSTWLQDDFSNVLNNTGIEQLQMIRNSVEKMDNLISGMLEYTTIGKNILISVPVNLNLVVNDIIESINAPEHISIKVQELPTVNGDKNRLSQLFQNLILNAIIYNDKPHGLIEIKSTEKENCFEFEISDNGKGIDKVHFKKIFKIFEKLENDTINTGIGLSIAKKIVILHGGKIWLKSNLNEGSTFYFTLKK
jgi:signal transduction histidine kinase